MQALLLSKTIENEDASTAAFDREENTRSLNLLGVSSPEHFKINPNHSMQHYMLEPQLRLSFSPLLSPPGVLLILDESLNLAPHLHSDCGQDNATQGRVANI
jgi:hypothetical protein